jgi:formylglycine-generating enzyme required for sulfatase activity/enamine deaminase RidA (YjgF/YER057c/UK114 family)
MQRSDPPRVETRLAQRMHRLMHTLLMPRPLAVACVSVVVASGCTAMGSVAPGAKPTASAALPRVGSSFRDCGDCPEMVVVPAGRFVMGSAEGSTPRDADEGPLRSVALTEPLAISRTEITRAQFAQFVAATAHVAARNCSIWTGERTERVESASWQSPGFAPRDSHPVSCISWDDAQAFVKWLSQRAGKSYRLLSESEWEFAARAGTSTAYAFGDDSAALCRHGNVADRSARAAGGSATWTYADCDDGFGLTPAPVGSFTANAFGLHDMHGNVWEWVEDCYRDSYAGAPVDGSARREVPCALRVDRGGGFYNNRGTHRAAERASYPPAAASANIGLRVARSLAPPAPIVRHANPPPAPILAGVTLGPGTETLHLSGVVPSPLQAGVTNGIAAYGNTEVQAANVLAKIDAQLRDLGWSMRDVVKLTVFLVGDPAMAGRMDFAGFNAAYRRYFGTPENPNWVARSTMQIAGLASPNFLVEIEAIAARPAALPAGAP